MGYDPTTKSENGWRNKALWLSPEALQALERLKEKNGRASSSEIVSRCLTELAEIPSKTSEPDAVIADILERLERTEGELEQLREKVYRSTTRARTTVNKSELAKATAEWMVRNNTLSTNKIDHEKTWNDLKEQGVVVHATYANFRLWCRRSKDEIRAEVRKRF